jgi:hypothetical protein|tara:strand:+ start:75 stop:347 length:273 start_codon:yes stop_codon:yes gene_type:complete
MERSYNVEDLEKKVESLELKLDMLISKLDVVKEDTGKMSTHIDFIDNVYSKVKMPLFWICDKINSFKINKLEYKCDQKYIEKQNTEVSTE